MPTSPLSPDIVSRITEAVAGIRYGTVQIVIHDSQVVQIEKAEKIRLHVSPARTDRTSGGAERLPEEEGS